MVGYSGKVIQIKPITLKLGEWDLKLIIEQIVDFESFRVNGFLLIGYFEAQGWMNYFEIINKPIFPYLVKDFWVKFEAYDEDSASLKMN